jgi:hypothetical protein
MKANHFGVGKGEAEFQCARFRVEFLSEKVLNILSNDPTAKRWKMCLF